MNGVFRERDERDCFEFFSGVFILQIGLMLMNLFGDVRDCVRYRELMIFFFGRSVRYCSVKDGRSFQRNDFTVLFVEWSLRSCVRSENGQFVIMGHCETSNCSNLFFSRDNRRASEKNSNKIKGQWFERTFILCTFFKFNSQYFVLWNKILIF